MIDDLAALNQLKRRGWQPTPISTGWRLECSDIEGEAYFSMTAQWLSLIYPLKSMEKKGQQDLALPDRVRIYRYLLEHNDQIFMAKFSLDDQGPPLLMAEVPNQGSQQLLFGWAIDSLTRYISEYLEGNGPTTSQVAVPPLGTRAYYPPGDIPGIPKEIIESYLKGIETNQWRVITAPQETGLSWHLSHKSRLRVLDAYLTVTQNWVYLQIPILLERVPSVLAEEIHLQDLFFKYLLQLNCTWYMAKLGLNSENHLLLLLELPTETLDFSLFQLAINTVATYLDRYMQEIQIMASLQYDQRLVELLTRSNSN